MCIFVCFALATICTVTRKYSSSLPIAKSAVPNAVLAFGRRCRLKQAPKRCSNFSKPSARNLTLAQAARARAPAPARARAARPATDFRCFRLSCLRMRCAARALELMSVFVFLLLLLLLLLLLQIVLLLLLALVMWHCNFLHSNSVNSLI